VGTTAIPPTIAACCTYQRLGVGPDFTAGSITKCLGSKEYVPVQMRVSRNSLEFNELSDQNQNRYRLYPHHCASNHFAPMSAGSGKSTIDEIAEEPVMQRMTQNTTFASDRCDPSGPIVRHFIERGDKKCDH